MQKAENFAIQQIIRKREMHLSDKGINNRTMNISYFDNGKFYNPESKKIYKTFKSNEKCTDLSNWTQISLSKLRYRIEKFRTSWINRNRFSFHLPNLKPWRMYARAKILSDVFTIILFVFFTEKPIFILLTMYTGLGWPDHNVAMQSKVILATHITSVELIPPIRIIDLLSVSWALSARHLPSNSKLCHICLFQCSI